MRRALQDSIQSRARAVSARAHNIPAPTGGWNTRDSLAEMPPLDAPALDNWYPRLGQCVLRGGVANYSTGMSGSVQSLFTYAPTSGTQKLLGATNAGIYDCTAGGAVGATIRALTNGYINTASITNSAGTSYLWLCNGVDGPYFYDGATFTVPTITVPSGFSLTATNLIYPLLFKHRIFAIEKNTLNLWYLPIDSVQGVANVLPFGNLMRRGGSLTSATSWTLDAGEGSDDLLAVISSEGELAVYRGTDPSSASAWVLIGVWYTGRPLGRRCFTKLGGDVCLITENGVFPLGRLLHSGTINFASALSNKIQPSITNAVATIGISTLGWETVVYPKYDALIFNVPAGTSAAASQAAMNTITGAWCSFSGWTPLAFNVFGGQLYFGMAGGIVAKAWDGTLTSDFGANITTTVHTAYNYFGSRTQLKHIEVFRPLFTYDNPIAVAWNISSDYSIVNITSSLPAETATIGATWDISAWDTSFWAADLTTYKFWKTVNHVPGFAFSLWLQTQSINANITWSGTDYIFMGGGLM